jgi:cytochrome c oxidase assembly protein subunit 15
VVTGTGPHSGDKHATHRLPFSLVEVTQLHADLVWLLVGLAVGVAFALRATTAPSSVRRRAGGLLVVVLAQGTVGYLQYATNLPIGLVAVHVLGACLVWVAALWLALGMTERVRPVGTSPDGSRESSAAPAATT